MFRAFVLSWQERSLVRRHNWRSCVAAWLPLLYASLLVGGPLRAQPAGPRCDDGTTPKAFDEMFVRGRCFGPDGKEYVTTREAELGDTVFVLVNGLARFRPAGVDLTRVVLFLDGQPLKGLKPELPGPQYSHLKFRLRIDTGNRDTWKALLSGAVRRRAVDLSVGFEGQPPLRTEVDDFRLIAIPGAWLAFWLVMCLAVLVVLVWYGRSSNLLRDFGPAPGGGALKPFSLARTQMAAWFFVVLAAYVFLWLVTGALDTLTTTVIGLMGISAATAVAGNAMDAGKQTTAAAAAGPAAPTQSVSFFTDIFSDEHGMSLARLQIGIWTLVLAVIFARSVFRDLAMPEFDSTLLGLMGISNGTYLGFKGAEEA
jgi:hypothetical protein